MIDLPEGAPDIRYQPPTKARQGAMVLTFPDGVELRRYDDGSYKLGAWDNFIVIEDMRNHQPGGSRGSGYVKAYFVEIDEG